MNAQAVPGSQVDDPESANDRFKRGFDNWLWSSLIAATVLHFSLFTFWPSMSAQDISFTVEELEAITLPPEIKIPEAPERIARPATPVISSTYIDEDITIAPTTFLDNPVEELPMPTSFDDDAEARDLSEAPAFTPYTVAPLLVNRTVVAQALQAKYPPLFRDANIGGTVGVHVFIDAEGQVQNALVHTSSGYAQFDEVALSVVALMEFTPAMNRDKRVPVWISLPVMFQVL
ncbi:MAG TPA: energy transducer TonB [Longimicrobiales bacterium]|jgi:protein TonB